MVVAAFAAGALDRADAAPPAFVDGSCPLLLNEGSPIDEFCSSVPLILATIFTED